MSADEKQLFNLKTAVSLIAEQTARSDEIGRVTLNLARSIVENADARISALEAGLKEALENWASAYEDQRTSSQSLEHPRIAELRKLLRAR